MNIKSICPNLKLADNGIWYGDKAPHISYPEQSSDNCFAVEDNSFWFKHRNDCINSAIASFPPPNNEPIFDIGGGNGFVSNGIQNSGFKTVLVEPSNTGALNAKKRGIETIICATADIENFQTNSLPAIGLFDVLEHIEDAELFLDSMLKLMKHNSRLYLTVPSYQFLWSSDDHIAGHYKRYSLNAIQKLLKTAGFEIEYSSYIFRFLPLPIFLFRSLPYKLGIKKANVSSNATSRDHATDNNLINKITNMLFRSEIKAIRHQKKMSFGGSCLVVAKKV